MSTPYEIPLTAEPQSFEIQLANTIYHITIVWNPASACWVLNIYTTEEVPVLLGIPVVTGVDLLAPYAYLNFGGALVAQTDHDADAVPTYANLGSTSHIYFVVT